MADVHEAPQLHAVVTTIQPPTRCMRELDQRLGSVGGQLLVAGDRKGPATYDLPRATLLDLDAQRDLVPELAPLLPENHYARKNIGYLVAMQRRAGCIYETDDDNAPNERWAMRSRKLEGGELREATADGTASQPPWLNVFRLFSSEQLWPRGYPLDRIGDRPPCAELVPTDATTDAPIQQGLVDDVPDVDAIWRLVMNRPLRFDSGGAVLIPRGLWCPFNTQSTWWWPPAFPLMYLPSHCSFRMTDIWRSFVAQRCLWEFADGIVFHAPEVEQERNPHDLMRDFEDEIPGYTRNHELVARLASLELEPGTDAVADNLTRCYSELIAADFFPPEEMPLVEGWLTGISARPCPTP